MSGSPLTIQGLTLGAPPFSCLARASGEPSVLQDRDSALFAASAFLDALVAGDSSNIRRPVVEEISDEALRTARGSVTVESYQIRESEQAETTAFVAWSWTSLFDEVHSSEVQAEDGCYRSCGTSRA